MKILHITTSIGAGGAEATLYRLVQQNQSNQHIVVSLTGDGVYADKLRKAGATVRLLQLKNSLIPVRALWELRKIIKQEKPDVVQTWMYHSNLLGGVIARSAGLKNIYWNLRTSDPRLGSVGNTTYRISQLCAKLSNIIPIKIISCAHKATESHIKLGYPESKIVTICNGYDLSTLQYNESSKHHHRERWGIDQDDLLLGVVARWHPKKDHATLLKALHSIKGSITVPWKLVLAGSDMSSDNIDLVELIDKHQLSDHCVLLGSQEDTAGYMSALDINVLTSTDEGFPNVIAEAMACKTPCISTDTGDAAFIISDTGWVSPVKDVQSVADNLMLAINEFANKPLWQNRCELAASRIQANFSIQKMVTLYESTWQSSLEKTL